MFFFYIPCSFSLSYCLFPNSENCKFLHHEASILPILNVTESIKENIKIKHLKAQPPKHFISVEASSILYIWNWLFMEKHRFMIVQCPGMGFNTTVCAFEVLHFTQTLQIVSIDCRSFSLFFNNTVYFWKSNFSKASGTVLGCTALLQHAVGEIKAESFPQNLINYCVYDKGSTGFV